MTQEQLNRIIEGENERLEEQTVEKARRIIASISQHKQSIRQAEENIVQLQQELKKLEIVKLDTVQILGN